MSAKDVFISYKAEEFDDANWVKSILENNGISCWMAPMCIPGGSSYAMEIPQAIRNCKVFVLILSKRSQESKWVPRELDQAINEGKTVLPFMLENCALKDDFNFYLTNVQRYAAYESKTAAIEKMLREINAIIGAKAPAADSTPVTAPDPKPEPKLAPKPESKPEQPKPEPKPKPEPEPKPEPKLEPAPAPAPKKKEKKSKKKGIKRFIPLIVLGGVSILITLIIVIASVVGAANEITVAGVECNVNSTSLYIDNADITAADLEEAEKIKALEVISFTNCTLPEDIGSLFSESTRVVTMELCSLTDAQLKTVDFEKTPISNLNLSGNFELSDISFVCHLADTLTELRIDSTAIKDFSCISELEGLTRLGLRSTDMSDASVVSGLTKLTYLDLGENSLTSLAPLSELTALEEIKVDFNELSDLSGLENAIRLTYLLADNNQLTSLKGLENTTVLKTVILNDNKLSDVALLGNSSATLRELRLHNNDIAILPCISNCTELTYLTADNNMLTNLDFISKLTKLETFTCSGNLLIQCAGIENCTLLKTVDLSGNMALSGTLPLDNFEYSAALDLSDTDCKDLQITAGKYSYLSLHNTRITDYSQLYSSTGNTLVIDYSDSIDLEALKAAEFYEIYLIDCPLNKQVSVSDALGKYRVKFETAETFEQSTEPALVENNFPAR